MALKFYVITFLEHLNAQLYRSSIILAFQKAHIKLKIFSQRC